MSKEDYKWNVRINHRLPVGAFVETRWEVRAFSDHEAMTECLIIVASLPDVDRVTVSID